MKMDKVANSGNDEFYTPDYAIEPLSNFIRGDARIWCPFDTEESLIVKHFRLRGNKVLATHIQDGFDFFKTWNTCDLIVSNPPYSKKTEVFERLFKMGFPFAMLVGIVGLFESQKRFEMFASNNFEILYMNKRISYFKNLKEQKPSVNPPFSSVWLCKGVLPKNVMFEKINCKTAIRQRFLEENK